LWRAVGGGRPRLVRLAGPELSTPPALSDLPISVPKKRSDYPACGTSQPLLTEGRSVEVLLGEASGIENGSRTHRHGQRLVAPHVPDAGDLFDGPGERRVAVNVEDPYRLDIRHCALTRCWRNIDGT